MSLELAPYDMAKAQKGAQIVTRDFRPVQFICHNPRLQEGVRLQAQVAGLAAPMTYFETGRRLLERETKYDLFLAVEKRIRVNKKRK